MTSTSGALKRLLDDRGEVVKKDLIAFVPINVRGEGDTAELGNQISGMLVALHVDAADPLERLRAISSDALKTVGEQRTHRAKIFQDVPRVLGPTLLSLGGKFVSAFGLFDHVPMANLMISSVPGPPIPLWLSGFPVEAAAPFGGTRWWGPSRSISPCSDLRGFLNLDCSVVPNAWTISRHCGTTSWMRRMASLG